MWLIAESDRNDPRVVRTRDAHGYGMHAQWSDDFHHALHVALTGERNGYYQDFEVRHLAHALDRGFVYAGDHSNHRQRRHGRPAGGVPLWRLVGYAQNHDQVGNRPHGERLSHLAGFDGARVAAALVLTSPFVPLLFMGEEWGATTPFQFFTDFGDPALASAVREGRRAELASFGWRVDDPPDPGDPATFQRSKLDWSELGEAEHHAMVAWYRDLIALRRSRADLSDGRRPTVLVDLEEGVVHQLRGATLVVANLSHHKRRVEAEGTVLLACDGVTQRGAALHLPPRSAAILDVS